MGDSELIRNKALRDQPGSALVVQAKVAHSSPGIQGQPGPDIVENKQGEERRKKGLLKTVSDIQ
jgi:hypothetical protein